MVLQELLKVTLPHHLDKALLVAAVERTKTLATYVRENPTTGAVRAVDWWEYYARNDGVHHDGGAATADVLITGERSDARS